MFSFITLICPWFGITSVPNIIYGSPHLATFNIYNIITSATPWLLKFVDTVNYSISSSTAITVLAIKLQAKAVTHQWLFVEKLWGVDLSALACSLHLAPVWGWCLPPQFIHGHSIGVLNAVSAFFFPIRALFHRQ